MLYAVLAGVRKSFGFFEAKDDEAKDDLIVTSIHWIENEVDSGCVKYLMHLVWVSGL